MEYTQSVEKWGMFQIEVPGKTEGNPFTDYDIRGEFVSPAGETSVANGFYDGEGTYVVRFMPSVEGEYRFNIRGTFSDREENGTFQVVKPSAVNHGPVRVRDTWHLAYEDGTPYYSLGTTCYGFVHQKDALVEQTFRTLEQSAFNKIRFCVFPKHYDYNYDDPQTFPYEGTPCDNSNLNRETMFAYQEDKSGNHWEFDRFQPSHFKRLERAVERLLKLGIEADMILFHPYDRWGFDGMGAAFDDLYVKYVVARFAAYRNVWWSLANEYDYVKTKSLEDWNRIGELIHREDPYFMMCSVHNGPTYFDFSKEWITHCSCQGTDRYRAVENTHDFRMKYQKPVIWDEMLYEGNIDLGWGNISGPEMVRRFWEAAMRGGYAGHGETILPTDGSDIDNAKLWWAHGGTLKGESAPRIAFLSQILSETPRNQGLKHLPRYWDAVAATTEDEKQDYFLFYFSFLCPYYRNLYFDEESPYQVDVIDTWNMTVENQGVFKGHFRIIVGEGPYKAIRVRKVQDLSEQMN